MDEKEKNLTPDAADEAVNEIPVSPEADDSLEEKDGVKYETNDNWQFEAEAPTLNDDLFAGEIHNNMQKPEADKAVPAPAPATDSTNTVTINKSIFKIIPAVILILAVTAVLIVLGYRYYTVPNGREGDRMNPGSVVATIGDTDVSIGMYNYFFSSYVNYYQSYASYGYYEFDASSDLSKSFTTDEDGKKISWLDLIQKQTMGDIKNTVVYYEKALENGITLTKQQKEAIESNIDNFKTSASEEGVSLNEYIVSKFGEYVTEDTIRLMLEQYYLAANYRGQFAAEEKITDDEIKEYYDGHTVDYYDVDISYLVVSYDTTSEETKKASEEKAKKYMNKITDRESIEKLVPEVYESFIENDIKTAMQNDSELSEKDAREQALKSYMQSIDETVSGADEKPVFGEKIKTMLFDSDVKVGAKDYYINKDTGYIYIILKTNQPERMEEEQYSVRHILVYPAGKEALAQQQQSMTTPEFTDDEWKKAEKQAKEILKKYESGDKTELSFAQLAEAESADVGSTTLGSGSAFGGLCENVSLGAMQPEFEAWSVDDSREYGDTGIVKTEFGYHVMFFVRDCPAYESSVISAIKEDRLKKLADETDTKIHNAVMKKAGKVTTAASTSADNTQAAE